MAAYRDGGEKRPRRAEPPERPSLARRITVAVTTVVLCVLVYVFWKLSALSRPAPQPVVAPEPSVSSTATATATSTSAPSRPTPLSEQQHRATVAAIGIAGAAQQSGLEDVVRLAMALADANTDPKTTCGQYDVAYVALRQAVLALPAAIEAGTLGDVAAELADLEAARCAPGSDAGG